MRHLLENYFKKLLINLKKKEKEVNEQKREYLKVYCERIQTTHIDRIETLWKDQIEPIHKANKEKILNKKKRNHNHVNK